MKQRRAEKWEEKERRGRRGGEGEEEKEGRRGGDEERRSGRGKNRDTGKDRRLWYKERSVQGKMKDIADGIADRVN